MKRRSEHADGPHVLRGVGAVAGIAIGPAFFFDRGRVRTPRYHLPTAIVPVEIERLEAAFVRSDSQLEEIQRRVERVEGGAESASSLGSEREYALILDAHRAMLHDRSFRDEIGRLIREENLNAEWALRRVVRGIKGRIGESGDEYFRERRADLDFLADRVVRTLLGQAIDVPAAPPVGCILVCHELSPADAAVLLMPGKGLGLVTDVGGPTGHTALVARAREIPTVVGTGDASAQIATGAILALDGEQGIVLIDPQEDELARLREGQNLQRIRVSERVALAGLPAETPDGVRVRLLGNIEFPEELVQAVSNGGEGVGLYRTEFLYLNRQGIPTEDDHYETYRQILEAAGPRPVTIRTFDLGMDKVPSGIRHRETNPAMGVRGIRYLLKQPQLLHTQLRALLRASSHGNLRIMFPMISGLTELHEARAQVETVRAELARTGEHMADRVPLGIMIEVPAAAQIADRLARECDFFSIGTNDLIQYTLAIDRQNPDVSYLYKPLHLGILRMLEFIARSAHAAGIPVAMCGEMAAVPAYSAILVALGLDELSMAPSAIPSVKQSIRAVSAIDAKQLLAEAMAYSTGEEIERYVRTRMRVRIGDLAN